MGYIISCCLKEIKKHDDIINQGYIEKYPCIIELKYTENLLNQMKNCIFRIYGDEGMKGTGFFCKIPFPDKNKLLTVLITNNHVINETSLNKKEIKILFNNKLKSIRLKNRITYTNEDYDVTIIQIKEEDGVKNYLELEEHMIYDITDNELNYESDDGNIIYNKQTIYIIQYPRWSIPSELEIPGVSFGIITGIEENKYNINHSCNTEVGSSGSPILTSNNKLIGIHKGAKFKKSYNCGSFLNYPIKEFIAINNDDKQIKLKLNEKIIN